MNDDEMKAMNDTKRSQTDKKDQMNHDHMAMGHHGDMDRMHMDHDSEEEHAGMAKMQMEPGSMDHAAMDHMHMNHGDMDHMHMDHGSMDHGGGHMMHMGNLKQKFWVSLIVMIPVLLLSQFMGMDIHLGVLQLPIVFPGSDWLVLILSSFLFFYGGWPFLTGGLY